MKKKLPKGNNSTAKPKSRSLRPDRESRSFHRRSPWKKEKKNLRSEDAPAAVGGSALDDRWDVSQFRVPQVEGRSRFHDFDLPNSLLHAIFDLGFEYCTPIQAEILPSTLSGKDASGRAQTGTGKTAAFLVTVVSRILKNPLQIKRKPGTPRILVLAPTRELVLQISDEARRLSRYCGLKAVSVFGGMNYVKQKKELAAGPVDIIVATPGRLLDFKHNRDITLNKIEVLIIDEADRMLDMGFIPDVRKIINSTPGKDKRQTMFFSATLTGQITRLASQWTRNPVTIEIEPEQVAVETVEQIVYIVTSSEKFALLFNIIDKQNIKRVLVFCNRRDEVTRLAEMLTRYGINCSELSGDVPQKKRIQRLDKFKAGKIRVLVATDVAGRGIHIEGMDHVINFTLPHDPEDYVHRIGRTGRAGATGTSISFADEDDSFYIPAIEKFIGCKLSCIEPEEEWLTMPKPIFSKKKSLIGRRKKVSQSFQREKPHSRLAKKRRPRNLS
ncbi:MAG: ATP-dependent RNA helicase RhlB [Desulfobacteraceae bacterium Eth-SRB1]|nr:MAG: ATP-dependent RNA helicase RhlB [Desulfobacteraceae bacterium Eth-SRB1]